MLSDFYPPSKRNRALTIFYTGNIYYNYINSEISLAIPVGAALGFGLGGIIGQALGWRYAFLICGKLLLKKLKEK
jgi:MFS family permease